MKNLLRKRVLQAMVAIVPVTMMPSLQASPIVYSFQTLDNSGDPAFNQLLAINNSGVIGGYFGDGVILPNKGYTLSPPYGPSNYVNENFPASAQTQVVGINTAGNTVGFWIDNNGNNFGFTEGAPSLACRIHLLRGQGRR
jgi:hypothetical protein